MIAGSSPGPRRRARAAARRALAAVALAGLLAGPAQLAAAAPAAAHSVGGAGASNWRSVVDRTAPEIDGLRVRVVANSGQLEVVNRTGAELVVLGYEGEPYLRLVDGRVWRNEASPAAYLNRTRWATTQVPAEVSAAGARTRPRWVAVGAGDRASWHDHRIHWMSRSLPPVVAADPSHDHRVADWQAALLVGGSPVEISGHLDWRAAPSPLPWLLAAAAAALVVLAGVLLAARRRRGRELLALAAAGLALGVVAVLHAAGVAAAQVPAWLSDAGTRWPPVARGLAGALWPDLLAVGAVAVGGWLLVRGRRDAAFLTGAGGLALLLLAGLADLGTLNRSVPASALPETTARWVVAAALGLASGVVAASVVVVRRAGGGR